MDEYLLSIVIPTCDRQHYAYAAAAQARSACPEAQIVIHDNSESDMLRALLLDLDVVYKHCPKKKSFVGNFSAACSLAAGEYICVIGDDDGILPNIEKLVRSLSECNIDACVPEKAPAYFWPKSFGHESGELIVHAVDGSARKIDASINLLDFIRHGCVDYLQRDFVRSYHGIVKRDLYEKVKSKVGDYFSGLSPDIYGAMALSCIAENVISISYPVTIAGACVKSATVQADSGKHVGALNEAPHLKGRPGYEWTMGVPKFYSVETIWADSAMAALRDMGYERVGEFDPRVLCARCYEKHPAFHKDIMTFCSMSGISKRSFLRALGADLVTRAKRKARKGDSFLQVSGISNIGEAARLAQKALSDNGVSFELVNNNIKELCI